MNAMRSVEAVKLVSNEKVEKESTVLALQRMNGSDAVEAIKTAMSSEGTWLLLQEYMTRPAPASSLTPSITRLATTAAKKPL